MTRDIDLVREMMLALEADTQLKGRSMRVAEAEKFFPAIEKDPDVLTYHLMLIIDQQFLVGEYDRTSGRFALRVSRHKGTTSSTCLGRRVSGNRLRPQ